MLNSKKKLAYVDHNYHSKTRSGDFLRDVFKSKFLIKDFWIDKNLKFSEDFFLHNNFFFFQILPPIKILEKIKNRNIMWAPMYDSPHHPIGFSPLLWKIIKYYNIKVLSFSKNLTLSMNKSKVKFINLKYYKKSKIKICKPKKKVNIFFWYREDIKIEDWIDFFSPKTINKITLFDSENKNKIKIPNVIKSNFQVKYVRKNFSKKNNSFIKTINKNDIFVAPRKKEGIGMALVEALSQGKYLLGYNESTMNEYIENNKIGFLFPNKKKIEISLIKKYFNYRLKNNNLNYNKWQKDKLKILKFFNKKTDKTKVKNISLVTIYIEYYLRLIVRRLFNFTY
tara:strand:+ start:318 stop:1331 length:1014 start_codon:yes stop_codon:yes gene_type:complete